MTVQLTDRATGGTWTLDLADIGLMYLVGRGGITVTDDTAYRLFRLEVFGLVAIDEPGDTVELTSAGSAALGSVDELVNSGEIH